MSGIEVFFDTNVLLYLLSADRLKAEIAEELMAQGGVISVQVLNEFADVAARKFKSPWLQIRAVLSTVRDVCVVVPVSIDTHDRGIVIAERYKLRVYDSMIISAALQAGCTTLISEDMQSGQRIDDLTIHNPFVRH
jgi:predicted nucleic acid-binding protein